MGAARVTLWALVVTDCSSYFLLVPEPQNGSYEARKSSHTCGGTVKTE